MGAWRISGRRRRQPRSCAPRGRRGARSWNPSPASPSRAGTTRTRCTTGARRIGSARFSPDLGLRLRAPLWDLRGTYGGELVYYERAAPGGIWNHRGALSLDARPTRRTALAGAAQVSQAFDPAGARPGGRVPHRAAEGARPRRRAAALEWRADRRRRGRRHAARADGALRRRHRRRDARAGRRGALALRAASSARRRIRLRRVPELRAGAPATDETAFSHALRARARWQATRHVSVNAWAGPGAVAARRREQRGRPGGVRRGAARDARPRPARERGPRPRHRRDRASRARGLRSSSGWSAASGAAAFARGDGGLWRSGTVPKGADAVLGYAIGRRGGDVASRTTSDCRSRRRTSAGSTTRPTGSPDDGGAAARMGAGGGAERGGTGGDHGTDVHAARRRRRAEATQDARPGGRRRRRSWSASSPRSRCRPSTPRRASSRSSRAGLPADFFPAQYGTSFEDRMRTVKHGVLARPVLERVIRETDFYPDLRERHGRGGLAHAPRRRGPARGRGRGWPARAALRRRGARQGPREGGARGGAAAQGLRRADAAAPRRPGAHPARDARRAGGRAGEGAQRARGAASSRSSSST